MTAEFEDVDAATEKDFDECYSSKYLSAKDIGDGRFRVKIAKVTKEEMRQQNGTMRKKLVVFTDSLDKGIVLNVTNSMILADSLGRDPRKWVGCTIGIFTEMKTMGGRPTPGISIKVLEPFKAGARAAPEPQQPEPAVGSGRRWGDPEDPGFDPDLNDSPDFDDAAE
jgi:hypothetical protein